MIAYRMIFFKGTFVCVLQPIVPRWQKYDVTYTGTAVENMQISSP